MTAAYDKVVAALPHLSPEERARVAERIKMMGALAPAQSLASAAGSFQEQAGDDAAGEALEAIAGAVLRAAGERVAPAALRRAPGFATFRVKALDLVKFAAGQAPDRAARRALLALGFDLLYRRLQRDGFAVTSRVLMQCAHQVPGVLDAAFPGYARAGHLGMVVGRNSNPGGPNHGEANEGGPEAPPARRRG